MKENDNDTDSKEKPIFDLLPAPDYNCLKLEVSYNVDEAGGKNENYEANINQHDIHRGNSNSSYTITNSRSS